ncbi:hypothetical protein L914_15057 [Phytophthora nicotianae]|uniref:Uncharacterized protein n=1 Tax=Phytophthora nicotianae TaxID=4792 RepID=W2MQT9_PHYNI|nr:hypothetical protein L914_15057 [Phytophthora nicotianae]
MTSCRNRHSGCHEPGCMRCRMAKMMWRKLFISCWRFVMSASLSPRLRKGIRVNLSRSRKLRVTSKGQPLAPSHRHLPLRPESSSDGLWRLPTRARSDLRKRRKSSKERATSWQDSRSSEKARRLGMSVSTDTTKLRFLRGPSKWETEADSFLRICTSTLLSVLGARSIVACDARWWYISPSLATVARRVTD